MTKFDEFVKREMRPVGEQPIFEIVDGKGARYAIYLSGATEGFTGPTTVTNKIPLHISRAKICTFASAIKLLADEIHLN